MFVGHADFQGRLQGSKQSFGNFVRGKDLIGNPVGRSVFLQLARKLLFWKFFLQLVRKKS
jgi:hypothetical protein